MTVHFMTTSYVLLDREHSHPLSLTNISKIQDENLNYEFNWLHRQGTSSWDGVLLKIPAAAKAAKTSTESSAFLTYDTQSLCQNKRPVSYEQNVGYASSTQFKMPLNAFVFIYLFALTNSDRVPEEDSWSVDQVYKNEWVDFLLFCTESILTVVKTL